MAVARVVPPWLGWTDRGSDPTRPWRKRKGLAVTLPVKLLLIDGDAEHGSVLAKRLGGAGYRVDWNTGGREGTAAALSTMYDIVILDARLPDVDGLEICRALMKTSEPPAVLLLSSSADVDHRVQGLDAGADDCLVKPFAHDELLARLRALLRRRPARRPSSDTCLMVGDLVLDRETRQAWSGHQRVELTAREFRLLAFLVQNFGRPLGREMILSQVWDEPVSENSVDVYVGYVRRKLESLHAAVQVETVRGIGFRLASAASSGPQAPYGIEPICKVLPIAPSTYHAHAARQFDPSRRSEPIRKEVESRESVVIPS